MVDRARKRLGPEVGSAEAERQAPPSWSGRCTTSTTSPATLDLAVAVNSVVMPDTRDIDRTLAAVRASLEARRVVPRHPPGDGRDPLSYDAAPRRGPRPGPRPRGGRAPRHLPGRASLLRVRLRPLRVPGPPPEVLAALRGRAPLRQGRLRPRVRLEKVLYPWDDTITGGPTFAAYPRSWDWAFQAQVPE